MTARPATCPSRPEGGTRGAVPGAGRRSPPSDRGL